MIFDFNSPFFYLASEDERFINYAFSKLKNKRPCENINEKQNRWKWQFAGI